MKKIKNKLTRVNKSFIDFYPTEYFIIDFRERGVSILVIGEAAKRFDISNRILRYWEDEGILKGIRMENGYRFSDDENITRNLLPYPLAVW